MKNPHRPNAARTYKLEFENDHGATGTTTITLSPGNWDAAEDAAEKKAQAWVKTLHYRAEEDFVGCSVCITDTASGEMYSLWFDAAT